MRPNEFFGPLDKHDKRWLWHHDMTYFPINIILYLDNSVNKAFYLNEAWPRNSTSKAIQLNLTMSKTIAMLCLISVMVMMSFNGVEGESYSKSQIIEFLKITYKYISIKSPITHFH